MCSTGVDGLDTPDVQAEQTALAKERGAGLEAAPEERGRHGADESADPPVPEALQVPGARAHRAPVHGLQLFAEIRGAS